MVVLRRGIQFSLDHLNQLCSKHVLLPVLLIHGYQYGVIRNIRSHHLLGTYQKTLLVSIRPHRLAHSGDSSTHALHCQVGLASGGSLGRDWRRRPGRPCARWTDQLHNDTGSVPANLWRQAILRGHGGAMWQPRLATRRRRWRRWQRRRPYLKCVIINVYAFLTVCCVWIWWFYSQRLKSLTLIWAVTSTVDQQLHELVAARDEYTWEFFRVLALCHTVVSVQSPDGTMISFLCWCCTTTVICGDLFGRFCGYLLRNWIDCDKIGRQMGWVKTDL